MQQGTTSKQRINFLYEESPSSLWNSHRNFSTYGLKGLKDFLNSPWRRCRSLLLLFGCGDVVACKVLIVKFLKWLLSMWYTFCGGVKGYCCGSVVVQLLLVKLQWYSFSDV